MDTISTSHHAGIKLESTSTLETTFTDTTEDRGQHPTGHLRRRHLCLGLRRRPYCRTPGRRCRCRRSNSTSFNMLSHTNNIIYVYGTRSYDMLHLYTVNSSFGARCIKFKGCLLWNSLPRSITNINSHVVFKRSLNITCVKACRCDCTPLALCGLMCSGCSNVD